jgi:glycosyltransferase involved in cell wall biosynthesis
MMAKRVLYLAKGGNIGGAHCQLLYLLQGLAASYEPVVICTSGGEIVDRLKATGIDTTVCPLVPWRKARGAVRRYVDAERLVGEIESYEPVLLHASDMWLGNYLSWVQGRLRIPSVVHVRAPVRSRDIRKHRLRSATGLIAISTRITRALMAARIPAERVVQIEDVVDIQRFQPRSSRLDVLSGTPSSRDIVNVGLVGRIESAKRQVEYLQAACDVLADLPGRVRFFVIGETRNYSYFRRLKRLGQANNLNGQLVFTGRRDDMPEVLNSLDILVSLSGGSVMYEAMSCGVCVVSAGFTRPADSMHLRDGVTGVVIPSQDPKVLAAAVKHLVGHPRVRHRLGAAAHDWAQKRLSHVTMAARVMEFYDRLSTDRCS